MRISKSEKLFIVLFSLLLLAEIVASSLFPFYSYFTKPTIILALIIFYWQQNTPISTPIKRLILGALFFSLLGDILLMFVDKSAHYFTAGLAAFLTAHIMYILVFLKHRNTTKKPFVFGMFLVGYGAVLFYFLEGNLGSMHLPVILYMAVILSMAITAYLRKGMVTESHYILVFAGAILFMISDSLLALNKFHAPLPLSNISIMFTYGFAQLCLVFGLLKQR